MKPQNILTWVLIFGAVVLTTGVLRGEHSISSFFSLQTSKDVLSEAVAKLEKENNDLESEILKLKKSKDYAKKVLRDKYHIKEDDEKVIFFAD